jgi:hypothetical protein
MHDAIKVLSGKILKKFGYGIELVQVVALGVDQV